MEAQESIATSTPPRIFISYARSDGEEFARNLRRRLIDEYSFSVWQDRTEIEVGKAWWQQIETALISKHIEYLVLVITKAKMESEMMCKECWLAIGRNSLN